MAKKNNGALDFTMKAGNRLFVLSLVVCLCWIPTVAAGEKGAVTISAAMSLKDAFEDITGRFKEKYHPVTVYLNLGASGDLARQIAAGAPVDVFASASQRDMDLLDKKGAVRRESRVNFTGNGIVLIQPLVAATAIESWAGLSRQEVERIALGNPQSVPAGAYGAECLEFLALYKTVQPKLIFCGHVRQVLDYTARGEVDAGLVYATDAQLRANEVRIVARAPGGSHRPIVYPIAIVKNSQPPSLAQEFIDFVMSEEGQAIFLKYGFARFSDH